MRWLVLVTLLLASAKGFAEDVAPSPRTARLLSIKDQVRREAHRTAVWKWAWVGTYGVVTVAQVAPIPFLKDKDLVIDFAVGAVSSAIGVAGLVFLPLAISQDADEILAQPDSDEGLARAEELVRKDAADERANVGWLAHAGNVVVNLVVGLVLGLGWKHWESAAISFGVGTVLGEVTLFTQSTALEDTLRLAPVVTPAGGGLSLSFLF